ncbi:DUF2845 domain-containing protein [Stutzerimonas zhaodongensis]|uniref:DUF2845 domain-containing protein n=1 Tax=Stutzerimonas zhaodongensis TaxID=1176257 RepID=UPI0021028707|nr:DUF2845 domain-containing protein [Stutzerimonas zhaodongensis]MCQ2029231.1 DUF2845 domain-containing protein [Stutzerimonas zhaodongensis]
MSPASTVIALSVLVYSCATQAASTHRCGSALVSLDASTSEVRQKCGAPPSAALIGYKEVLDDYGFRHEVQVEEWTYGPTNGMYHFLRFEGNRLRRIESQRGR